MKQFTVDRHCEMNKDVFCRKRRTATTSCQPYSASSLSDGGHVASKRCLNRRNRHSSSLPRWTPFLVLLLVASTSLQFVTAFTTTPTTQRPTRSSPTRHQSPLTPLSRPFSSSSSSALAVTWFGGTAETEVTSNNDDSCELVAVRIERTSANSRRIFGEIVVPHCNLQTVWSILTDYNRLAVHVPNLVESRIVSVQTPQQQPGDGQYRCRLFQKGAQKIIGFEFGASVTMDMVERFEATTTTTGRAAAVVDTNSDEATAPMARSIQFKCYDSFFFSEFDGQWRAVEQVNPATGTIETLLSYVVDVRPKGPVPVAALEWRIREDVPTNLRAVKSAALLQKQQQQQQQRVAAQEKNNKAAAATTIGPANGEALTAYSKSTTPLNGKSNAATTTRSTRTNGSSNGAAPALTPRQRQEQLEAAAAARRALRRPSISPFAKAATPPPRQQATRKRQQQAAPQQRQAAVGRTTRMAKIKVDWDDNETLGAYLKRP